MYRPPKKNDDYQSNRQKLPPEVGCPSLAKVQFMLDEAAGRRGCLIELPWSQNKSYFILTCQWDIGAEDPVWTLYEEDAGTSKVLWTQSFPQHEIEFMYDILVMSAPKSVGDVATSVEDLLKTGSHGSAEWRFDDDDSMQDLKPSKDDSSKEKVAEKSQNAGQQQAPAQAQAPPQSSQTGLPAAQVPAEASGAHPQYHLPPGMPYPPPGSYPPQMPPGYPYPMPYAQGHYPPGVMPHVQQVPGHAMQQPAMINADQSNASSALIPLDYHLLDKRPNILLGTMLIEADLLTEQTLEAALKLQELVREEKLPPERASALLKKHHTKGASIDEYVTPMDRMDANGESRSGAKKGKAEKKSASGGSESKKSSSDQNEKSKQKRNLKPAFDLIQKAGVLTESDIEDALAVRRKHGGDLVNILEAAGKINRKTVDAAFICLTLLREGLMKQDKCFIALNYCARMRVGFDEALDEMGWENPRKLRSDLPL